MRAGVIIVAIVLAGTGCAGKRPAASVERQRALAGYREGGGAALAFDPPAVQDGPRLDLSRDRRERWAFLGFEQTTATFFYLRMDDRQTEDGRNDRLERRAISERVGTSYR